LARGLDKLEVNAARLAEDLDRNWDVLAEPIQTVMRKYSISDAYEQLKDLTRGKGGLTPAAMQAFVKTLAISDADKKTLAEMTPASYIGTATKLARDI
jgi:adenylosuccinate lyase